MRLCCAVAKAWLLLSALWLAPALVAEPAAADRQYRFNVPAGEAEAALKLFAVQSGRQVLFPTAVVASVQTNAVKGRYTLPEALDLLLAGTPLLAREDEPTGSIAISRVAMGSRVIELPLFVVNENAEQRWRYAAMAGIEVLSRCPDETTRMLIAQNDQLLQLLELLVPARFQINSDVPARYVLYRAESQPAIAREIIAELDKRRRPETAKSTGDWSVRVLPNYRFWDHDTVAIFFILSGADFNKGRLTITPDYLRYRLEARAPSLPPWFVEGIMELYRSVTLETAVADLAATDGAEGAGVVFWPMTWGTEAVTQGIKKNPRQKRELPDMAGLFGEQSAVTKATPAGQVRRAQAALLIRWALADLKGTRRDALWKFVELTCREPATEAVFRDCFAMDYAAAERELAAYLPDAVKDEFRLPLTHPARLPATALRDATVSEIGRIKGDLERLEIGYVDSLYPELTSHYATQARRTLRAAYDQGERDPQLLAVLGLCEIDMGDDVAAQPFMEAAMAGGVKRPRVGYELARIYFQAAMVRNPTGRLTPAEAGQVLQPLAAARRLAPPLPEVYELIAEVWLRSDGRPGPKQLAVLDEGIGYFPRRSRLIYSAALLHATHGFNDSALALVERGLRVATEPAEREKFAQLATALRAAKK